MKREKMTKLNLDPFFFEGGTTGCLLIHGFSGSPPEMRPMGEYLAEKGLTVLGVRLAGHGLTPEDMAATRWPDWVGTAEAGLQELQARCDLVFVAGLSMGGLITLHLSAHHPLAGIIIMSAPAYVADLRFHILPLVQPFMRWVTTNIESDLTDPQAQERLWSYKRLPSSAVVSLRQLLNMVRRELSQVLVPALIMQGVRDNHIPHDSAQVIYDALGSTDKEIAWWPNSGHAITVDSEREAIWERTCAFINAHSK